MNEKEYTKPSGKLVEAQDPILGDYKYFLPNEPPIKINISQEIGILLSEAERKLGTLSGTGSLLPDPHILINPRLYITKEAVLSSKIEGTLASVSDVLKYQIQKKKTNKKGGDEKEVTNYIKALEHGMSKIQTSKINYDLIKDMHKILLEGVRGEEKDPGEFRKVQNWIGAENEDISKATFIPPAPGALIKPLYDFKSYLERKDIPLLIQAAIMHYYFEVMHPFRDGNGRIGRLLIVLFLCKRRALNEPLLYISAYFEKHKQEYYKKLLYVSQKSDFEEWIQFFLKAVKTQSEDSLDKISKLTKLREKFIQKIADINAGANAIKILDSLFVNTYTSIKQVENELKTTFPTAKKAIEDLVKAGILTEITGKERYKLFCANEILEILEK